MTCGDRAILRYPVLDTPLCEAEGTLIRDALS